MFFFAPGTLVDPPLAPAVRWPGCPPAPPSDHWYGGLGVSLGDSATWKPPKVGGCGWTRCPRNRILSHVAQAWPVLGFGGLVHIAQILGLFGAFLGRFSDISWS